MSGGSMVASNDSRQLFTVGGTSYTVRDVMDAAHFRGEIEPIWAELQRLVACERFAGEQDREADEDALDAAAQAFRYEHDLITAEETERWLAERKLTLSDFSDYFARHCWGEAIGAIETESHPYLSASPQQRELLLAELTLSGELDRMAARLSWRLAAAAAGETPASVELIAAERQKFVERLDPAPLSAWLPAMDRDESWVNQMSLLEANFRIQCERILTPQARKRELSSLRLQLTMVDLEVIEFDSHDAASEALLCVREDGMEMEEVARDGRYPFRREQTLLEDIAPEIQQQFLSVSAGEVLEPTEIEGVQQLYRVLGKNEPDPADPAVRQRVDQRMLDRHFADLESRHVRWENALS